MCLPECETRRICLLVDLKLTGVSDTVRLEEPLPSFPSLRLSLKMFDKGFQQILYNIKHKNVNVLHLLGVC